jgi:peptidoglycan/LPS O-acetylase OafA/YrhL
MGLVRGDFSMGRSESGQEHYFFIDTLRAIACFMVVFHHCLGYFPAASFAGYYLEYLKPFFPTVTLYLLVSGFVHGSVIERRAQPYGRYVWDKFNRIMVPYFSISLLTLAIRLLAERSQVIALDEIQYTPFVWGQAGLRLMFSGVEGHYYFLELLFLYLLVFPFLVRGLQKPGKALLFLILVLALDPPLARIYSRFQSPLWSPVALVGATLSGFKFFLFGFVLNRFYSRAKAWLVDYGAPFGALCVTLFAYLHWALPGLNEYWVLVELLGYFCLARALFRQRSPLVSQISALSFGIYLLHQPYFIKLSRLLLVPLAAYPNVQLFSTWALTVALTTLAVKGLGTSAVASRWFLGRGEAKPAKNVIFLPVGSRREGCAGSGA